MRLIIISWYICIVFLVALLVESAVTTAPGGNAFQSAIMGVSAAFMVGSAAMALTFMWLGAPRADWLPKTMLGVAVVLTLAVLLFIIG